MISDDDVDGDGDDPDNGDDDDNQIMRMPFTHPVISQFNAGKPFNGINTIFTIH